MMIQPNDKHLPDERINSFVNFGRAYTVCIFCSLVFSIPFVNWTFCLSFFQTAILSVHAVTLTCRQTDAKESKELGLAVSLVDLVLKVR